MRAAPFVRPSYYPEEAQRPPDVGILALEVYFPRNKVDQVDLEAYDKVPAGKYTIGLGQNAMAFAEDQEDVVSMSLTVVQSLMEKYDVQPNAIGRGIATLAALRAGDLIYRLEVGTESSIDRSKSVKSFLMALFQQSGNQDVQGVDCINACYGGTAALFNAVNWIESRSWDGRYAIVVAADVAVYASGPARPSGGCGAVAMLIGPNAPLVLEPGYSAAHMDDVYDFYKPNGIFPQVQGKLSIACYLTAVDRCYARLCQKIDRLQSHSQFQAPTAQFSLADIDYCVMHAPFGKMVKKGFARLIVQDCLRERQGSHAATSSSKPSASLLENEAAAEPSKREEGSESGVQDMNKANGPTNDKNDSLVEKYHEASRQAGATSLSKLRSLLEDRGTDFSSNVLDRELEQAAVAASAEQYNCMAAPGTLLGRECGNMYAASVHANLASLVFEKKSDLEGKRILASSFGSGLAASIFCFRVKKVDGKHSVESIAEKLDLKARLASRRTATPEEFTASIAQLEAVHGKAGFTPRGRSDNLFPGTYYLQEVDDQFRRRYARKH